MKRLPQTLTAAVLTGALAFGGAAVAQAEEENYQFEQQDITQNLEQQDITQNLVEGDDSHVEGAENYNPEAKDAESEDDSDAADESDASGKVERHDKEQQDTSAIPGAATKTLEDGTVCYQHIQDKSVYVEDSNEVNTEITDETVGKCKDANAGATDPEGSSELSNAAKAAIGAAIALPILGGIVHYFLNKDGKTYVKDEARKNQEPTAEEKAASEQMLNANKDAVIAQGGQLAEGNAAPAAARGMSAETGSNSVAQALAALAVAAMVAAGAFAARRKFFA